MSDPNEPVMSAAPPPPPAAPPPAPPAPPAAPAAPHAAHAASAGPDAAAKLEEAMAGLKKNFSTAELLAGGGALLVVAVFVVFGVLLDNFFPSEVAFATSALLVLVIGGQRMGWIDLGASQRSLIILLGFVLGSLLVYSFLGFLRTNNFGLGGAYLIGLILTWVGDAAAAAGAYLTWKTPRS